jgi:hypothetical protein
LNVSWDHPDNAGVLRHLVRGWNGERIGPSVSPADVADPDMTLGTHPDLVQRLWDELGARLPAPCRWVVYGRPALVHPRTGLVFGFAGGTHTYGLRLPPAEHAEAVRAGARREHTYSDGSRLDAAALGAEWVLGGWLRQEPDWCLAAYAHAARA